MGRSGGVNNIAVQDPRPAALNLKRLVGLFILLLRMVNSTGISEPRGYPSDGSTSLPTIFTCANPVQICQISLIHTRSVDS